VYVKLALLVFWDIRRVNLKESEGNWKAVFRNSRGGRTS